MTDWIPKARAKYADGTPRPLCADGKPLAGRRSLVPGQKYHHLTAISLESVDEHDQERWKFKCDCGAIKIARANDVRAGKTKACGCKRSGWRYEAERAARASAADSLLRRF